MTIPSKDSGSESGAPDDDGSSSSSSGLGGGAIAGVVVGSVLGALLVAAIFTVFILRKRRKWMKAGFSASAVEPKPDESVLNGPVFNSPSRSTPIDPTHPPSSADIFSVAVTGSTPDHSRSGTDSLPVPLSAERPGGEKSTPELDGNDTLVRPDTELDGHEIATMPVTSQHPGVHELPGSEVRPGANREISSVGALPSFERSGMPGRTSERSMSVSTMGSSNGQGRGSASDLVSPSSPASHWRLSDTVPNDQKAGSAVGHGDAPLS